MTQTMNADRVSHPAFVIVTCVLASSLAFIDGSAVNVALPAIGKGLGGGAAGLQWLIGGYLLPLSALLLFGGSLGDRYGRRRLLVYGVALFGLASAACSLAPNLGILVAARFVQGIGAALLMPNSLALLGVSFDGEERGRAIGIWAAAGAATAAVGPVFGGWLVDVLSWRLIFVINLPVAVGAIALAVCYVNPDVENRNSTLDHLGALLATGGLGCLFWGLIDGSGGKDWTTGGVAGCSLGIGLLFAFLAWEGRRGTNAMMPLALFGSRSFVGLTLLTLLLYGALGGLMVLLPYTLIESNHYAATMAGAALLPLPIVLTLASPFLGGLAGRFGSRSLLVTGCLLVAAGCLLMLRISGTTSYWREVLPAILVFSIGLACAVAPLTTAVLATADPSHAGSASGFNSAIARTGGLVATTLFGGVLASRGSALVTAFHIAVVAIAVVSLMAGVCAMLVGGSVGKRSPR